MLNNRLFIIIALILLNISCDQVSKHLVRAEVEKHSVTPLIDELFTMHNVENSGAFLGIGSDLNPTFKLIFLLILPIVVLVLVLRYIIVKQHDLDWFTLIGLSFVIGGGIGNIYDRIRFGSVTDFFHIDLGGIFKTGIFNMADVSVMVGMGCIIASAFVKKKAKTVLTEKDF